MFSRRKSSKPGACTCNHPNCQNCNTHDKRNYNSSGYDDVRSGANQNPILRKHVNAADVDKAKKLAQYRDPSKSMYPYQSDAYHELMHEEGYHPTHSSVGAKFSVLLTLIKRCILCFAGFVIVDGIWNSFRLTSWFIDIVC